MATLSQTIGTGPLWAIGLCFFVLLVAACWAGARLRHIFSHDNEADTGADGQLLSAALALLGLLVAFTFSLALNRYDTRRTMIVAEGNAISTAWLRSTLVDGADGAALRQSIKAYADIRIRLPESSARDEVEAQAERAQRLIWARLRTALPQTSQPIGATLVNATTEMFDAAASRKAERNARLPGRVIQVVGLYALLSAGIVGYVLGRRNERSHAAVSIVLFVMLALAVTLILDLDRPWSGSIQTSPQPIIDARAAMD